MTLLMVTLLSFLFVNHRPQAAPTGAESRSHEESTPKVPAENDAEDPVAVGAQRIEEARTSPDRR